MNVANTMKASTLLVVDDEEEIREALSRHFRFLGYEVRTACNGQEALDVLEQEKIACIITDIVMPVMNGVDLLRVVRKEYPMVRVIIITGYVTQENVMACMRHDADTCIFKPWQDMTELEQAVTSAFGRIENWRGKLRAMLEMKPAKSAGKRGGTDAGQ